jgi:hypothetical protein
MGPTSLRKQKNALAILALVVLCEAGYAQKTCKPLICPKTPEKCAIVSARQKDGDGCLTRCEVLKCEPGIYSQDWKEVVGRLFRIISTDDAVREGLNDGLIISPEVKSFPVPAGTYEFLDPVTRNRVFEIHRISDPPPPKRN